MALDDSKLEHQILEYLSQHPDAQDTLDGIINRWLQEGPTEEVSRKVSQALDKLVAQGLILERDGPEACLYKLNRTKLKEVAAVLKAKD